ncbi:hypothetical protein [Natrarchaeobaculum aegyptiacum]|uniref:Uncharacterized protein n=1 Tax=Natrarchaeobaculum aegyptiacum TaxID=745377 RepID=A0A2Z2HRV6_9EURY|nr:hypothetical protein [Natrarchaeobaculum aegyptiacum]ARS89926.1 hypothetical protein B1756_09420 [Natrarchaeobaculum aegyptiacum]
MNGKLFVVLIAFVFVGVMLPAVGISFDDAERERLVDEELTLDAEEPVSVEYASEALATAEDVTIVVESDQLEPGDDFEWHSGDVVTLEEDLDGATAQIEYPAEIRTEETRNVGNLLSVFDGWYVEAIVLFTCLAAALAAAAWGEL